MSFLNRIADSRRVQTYLRFPSPRSLKIFVLVASLIALSTSIFSAYHSYHDFSPHAARATSQATELTAVVAFNLAICLYSSFMFLLVWALFYRIATDLIAGLVTFSKWAPTAYQSFLNAVQAGTALLCKFPNLLTRFFGSCGAAFTWLLERPGWWNGLDRKQRSSVLFNVAFTAAYIGTLMACFPAAVKLSAAAPRWMAFKDLPFVQAIFLDAVLSSIAIMPVSVLLVACFACLRRLWR